MEIKLLLQLEARMREREASDLHYKFPEDHSIIIAMKKDITQYPDRATAAGTVYDYVNLHLLAGAALYSILAELQIEPTSDNIVKVIKLAMARLANLKDHTEEELAAWMPIYQESNMFQKCTAGKLFRFSLEVPGLWPAGATEAEEEGPTNQGNDKYNPKDLVCHKNLRYIDMQLLFALVARAAGGKRIPGKAPAGGAADRLRRGKRTRNSAWKH